MVDSVGPHTARPGTRRHGLVTGLGLVVPRPGLRLDVALAEPSPLSNFRAILYGVFLREVFYY